MNTRRLLDQSQQQITCNPAQAAEKLGVGVTAVYALLKDGSIRSIKFGKSRLIIVQSLYEWVDTMESYGFGQIGGE
jgi:excisionase family DNA binding protein